MRRPARLALGSSLGRVFVAAADAAGAQPVAA